MRFPRQTKIFRGPLDAVPLAGVFFLLVIFLLLRSVLYTPGVLVQTGAELIVRVARNGEITFKDKSYTAKDLDSLRNDLKGTDSALLMVQADPGAPAALTSQIRELLRIELPQADGFAGIDSPTAIVAVNVRGQLFYENEIISESDLKAKLQSCLQAAQPDAKNLTLVLLQDGEVENKISARLYALARGVGIKNVLISVRPTVFAAPASRNAR